MGRPTNPCADSARAYRISRRRGQHVTVDEFLAGRLPLERTALDRELAAAPESPRPRGVAPTLRDAFEGAPDLFNARSGRDE